MIRAIHPTTATLKVYGHIIKSNKVLTFRDLKNHSLFLVGLAPSLGATWSTHVTRHNGVSHHRLTPSWFVNAEIDLLRLRERYLVEPDPTNALQAWVGQTHALVST